jgi:hypothetical protein
MAPTERERDRQGIPLYSKSLTLIPKNLRLYLYFRRNSAVVILFLEPF